MLNKNLAMVLGALTGLVGLAGDSTRVWRIQPRDVGVRWAAILSAMLPWIAYAAWRGRHGHLSRRGALTVLLLDLVGCVGCGSSCSARRRNASLAAFVVIWVSDWPPAARAARRGRPHRGTAQRG